jgi:hypothetical protein
MLQKFKGPLRLKGKFNKKFEHSHLIGRKVHPVQVRSQEKYTVGHKKRDKMVN